MFKKSFSILLVLMLCLTASFAVAEAQIPELEFDEANAAFEGTWVPFEAGFEMYLPTAWNMLEVSAEDAASGVLAVFANAENTARLAVTYGATTETDNAAMIASLQAAGMLDVAELSVNGFQVVSYTAADQTSAGMALLDGKGGAFAFTFAPLTEEFMPTAQTIFTSIFALEQ